MFRARFTVSAAQLLGTTHELITSIEIDAPSERVWEALVDFGRHPEWDPFMWIAGRPNEGATLIVRLRPLGGRESEFESNVVYCEKHRELRWVGHLVVPGLFDNEHRFHLELLDGDERIRFEHVETFSGALAGLLLRFVGEQTRAGFVAMNEGLKTRVEGVIVVENRKATESSDAV